MRKIFIVVAGMAALLACCVALKGNINEGSMTRAAADVHRLSNAVQGELWRGADLESDLTALACGRERPCATRCRNSAFW